MAVVPNFIANYAYIQQLQQQLNMQPIAFLGYIPIQVQQQNAIASENILQQQYIKIPIIKLTPLNKFNNLQFSLFWVFLTLYFFGQANFVKPYPRPIKYKYYIKYYIIQDNQRFVCYFWFRFIAFNILIRSQINKKSFYYTEYIAIGPIDIN